MVILPGVLVKEACGAALTVMVLLRVIVLPQLSVNVHVSVYNPPQALCEPVIVEVTEPEIWQAPVPLLE